ncbi:MAG: AraC family transcriptional regulator [Cytophagaceae bacterium]
MSQNPLESIFKWFQKFKNYKFSYKKGFFHINSIANSPDVMIEGFDRYPFCKHDQNTQLISVNTFFLKALLYYRQPEKDLWVYVSDMYYKKNMLFTNIFDQSIPSRHHFLNLHLNKRPVKSKSMLVNGISVTAAEWILFKAGHASSIYHFKDSVEKNITIYFTDEWLLEKFGKQLEGNSIKILQFFKSENKNILLSDLDSNNEHFYDDAFDLLSEGKSDEEVKQFIEKFFLYFIEKLNNESISERHFKLSNSDQKNVLDAENIMLGHLLKGFPGIDVMASQIGISPTKLKTDFKTVHNKSLYQYYSHLQMQFAYKVIKEKNISIKDVAEMLGYENPSKFSSRFKKIFHYTPSHINKHSKVHH